jgi:hypothetical protein
LQLSNNSIEGCGLGGGGCIVLTNPSGANGNLVHVVISGNEIGGGGASAVATLFSINSGTPRQWIYDANIAGNFTIGVGGGNCYQIAGTQVFNITGNTCDDTTTPAAVAISTASSSTVGTISANTFGANFTAANKYTIAGGSVVLHDTSGITTAALPAAGTGSTAYVTDGATPSNPCTGSSVGTVAIKLTSTWKCM